MKRIVLAGLVAITAVTNSFAENLAGKGLLLTDTISLNGGKDYAILAPPSSSKHAWQDTTPYTYPGTIDFYFPYAAPVSVSSVKFKALFDSILDGEVRAMVDGKWVVLGELKSTVKDRSKEFRITFKAIKTNHIQVVLKDVSNIDHDILKIVNWDIQGPAIKQAPLVKSSDLALTCDAKDNVFDLPNPGKIGAKVTNSGKDELQAMLKVTWQTYAGFDAGVPETKIDLTLPAGGSKSLNPEFKTTTQGCYRATVYLYTADGKTMLAAKRIMFGMRDKRLFEKGEVEEFMPNPDGIVSLDERYAKNSTIWGADLTQSSLGNKRPGEQFFKKVSDAGGEVLMSYLRYSQFEPLPGVYNFDVFDDLIRKARKYNLGLNMGLWWWDFSGPTQFWLADEHQREKDGSVGKGWKSVYSSFSPKFRQHSERAVELMLKRYGKCPEVWFWHPHPYGAVDHDGHGVKDYHPEALKAWAVYLEKKYESIDKLNNVYQSKYSDWSKVPVPMSAYEKLREEGKLAESTRVLNYSQQWRDWLDFYHQSLFDRRLRMMKLVRKYDQKRGIGGVNATGGVGKADATFKSMADHNAFYGDQGLNINHLVRRLTAKRQYGLKLRHEDIAPVTIGRRNLDENNIIDRCDWIAFQCMFLGLEHFNYVFTAWDNSPFWDRVFANPRAKRLVKESSKAKFVDRDVAYTHSFLTDVLEGKYDYQGISIYRWWLMNGFSEAIMEPGNYMEILSLGGDLSKLDQMKLAIDDSSRVMSQEAVDKLVSFVNNGGKLVLFAASGEKTLDKPGDYQLLKRLGYGDTSSLSIRNLGSANLTFNGNNGVFRRTISVPVNFWCELKVPKKGKVLGYIGDKTGAVCWPHGKGEVVLIAGLPGAIPEALGLELFEKFYASGKKKYKNVWKVWANAQRELAQITEMLSTDLAEWAGVPPQFRLNTDFVACLRGNGTTRLVYMYNKGPAQTPVFRIDLPQGAYRVTCETLTETKDLGVHKSEDLSAPGIRLPDLGSKRFMMLRIVPEGSQ